MTVEVRFKKLFLNLTAFSMFEYVSSRFKLENLADK